MKNNTHVRNKQTGATLVLALIVLIVLMILGVAAVMTANTQLKMAGNLQFENLAKNRAENQMAEAEAFLAAQGGKTLAAGFSAWAAGTKALHPQGHFATLGITNNNPLNMDSTQWLDNATGTEGYMIELLAANEPGYGSNAATGGSSGGSCASDRVNLFRVTARGVGGRGAVRFVQSIHEVVSC